ncbi:MAG: hypothetical protein IJ220_03030 [Clostridia bacterium]|nr:hypothetical protein [Clostridia bacterium]
MSQFRLKKGIEVIFACVRFSCNGSFIDNWSSGGFAANININTGIADTAQKKSSINSYNDISKGVIIPYFEDAKQIAIKAHGLFSDMKSIGWDIAITNEGPKLIEGNNDWDVILPQKLMQRGIKKILCAK